MTLFTVAEFGEALRDSLPQLDSSNANAKRNKVRKWVERCIRIDV
jgi:hypothetical protein